MSMSSPGIKQPGLEQREHDRSVVALPAIVKIGREEYGARILNIAAGGALIQCSAQFRPRASFVLCCGSINADSVIVWEKGDVYGVNFQFRLSEAQLKEQLSRSNAADSRKLEKGQPHSTSNRASTTSCLTPETRGNTASTALMSALENSHRDVESCLSALEAILAGELSGIGQLSAARLRLRKANMARTAVALEVCQHLMKTGPSQFDVRDLQRRELNVSQLISEHVQSWPVQTLQDDWRGYCRATRKVLEAVCQLIVAEKALILRTQPGGSSSTGPQRRLR